MVYPLLLLEMDITGKEESAFDALVQMQENMHKVPKSAWQAVLS